MNRVWKGSLAAMGIAVLLRAGNLRAARTAKTTNTTANAAAVKRGKDVFQQKCSVCHYDNSDQKKCGCGELGKDGIARGHLT